MKCLPHESRCDIVWALVPNVKWGRPHTENYFSDVRLLIWKVTLMRSSRTTYKHTDASGKPYLGLVPG
ncbi:hypothetical protein AHAS_Ahas19G0206600 [Arachis hypogaea]